MSTVYIVTAGSYSEYHIVAAFSSEENAQAFIDDRLARERYPDSYGIEPYPIDRWQEVRAKNYWRVTFWSGGGVEEKASARRLEPDLQSEEPIPLGVNHSQEKIYWYKDKPHARWHGYTIREDNTDVTVTLQDVWVANVVADDEQHAIKVAAEQVAMAKAQQAGIG